MMKEGCGDGHEGLPLCSDGARGSADERTLSSSRASADRAPAHPTPAGCQLLAVFAAVFHWTVVMVLGVSGNKRKCPLVQAD